MELKPTIKALDVYRQGLVTQVNQDDRLSLEKMECLIQKISHMLLLNFLNKKETKLIFIPFYESLISRGKINDKIMSLIDNPMFQKHVVLAIPYSAYQSHKSAFLEDFHFACVQDFSHISDIYQKVDSIYNEGFCHYIIVDGYRPDDQDYFLTYKNDVMSILLFEEE